MYGLWVAAISFRYRCASRRTVASGLPLSRAAAEGGPGENDLAHEARHLVAQPPDAPLGALEGQRGLAGDEVGEARRLAQIGATGTPPALAQLGHRRGLTGDHLVARRVAGADGLTDATGVARVAQQQQLREPTPRRLSPA